VFTKRSIAFNYLKAFILIIVLPILIIGLALNHFYINTLQKNASDRILQAMEQIAIGMANEGKRTALLTATIANDFERVQPVPMDTKPILDLVTHWNQVTDPNQKYIITRQIDSKLNYLFNYTNDIESVVFFFHGQGFYYYKNPPIKERANIMKMEGYQEAAKNSGQVILKASLGSFYYHVNPHYVLSGWIRPVISSFHNDVEMIYVGFRTDVFRSIYEKSNSIGEIIVVDEQGRIIGAQNHHLLGKSVGELSYIKSDSLNGNRSFIASLHGQKMFISIYTVQKTDWKLINIINYWVLTHDVERIWYYASAVMVLLILLFVIFTLIFFKDIIIPVNTLIKQMKLVEQGNFNATSDIQGNDEIFQLGQSFNKMVGEIKNLIAERDLKEQARRKAELEALKSQINPHFIANTLNSIRLMAMLAKVDSIKNMTEAFMKLLAASLSKDDALNTVETEIDYLQNYVYIMKVRYGDKFDIHFDIDDDIKNSYILKMVLQPLLENAILHGINELEEKGIIDIKGYRSHDDLIVEITDNGVGMAQEQVIKLLTEDSHQPKGFNSMGVMNVDKRIKLNYGNRYGLAIESVPDKFTRVKILLPFIKENAEGEKENV
jgi:two-component system, sensor histidine kinase YesM